MFKKIVPFNAQTHGAKRIKPVDNYTFAEKSYIASLVVSEFNRVAPHYPIVFLKEAESRFGVYALLGLQQGENLFVTEDGKWDAGYIPAIIRRYPFALGKGGEENQFLICIDEESDFLNEEEGEPLVEDGKPGQVVEKAKQYLSELYRLSELTKRFCQDLIDRDLLMPLNMQVRKGDGETAQSIAGCYGVNEKNLNEMPDDKFLELRKNGTLSLIFAHLLSLSNVEKLVKKRTKRKA